MSTFRCLFHRSFFLTILLLFATVAGANAQLQGDSYAVAKQKGEARVVYSYNETPGFVTKDADGNMYGLCIDLMKAFGLWLKKYEGIELKPQYSGEGAKDFKRYLSDVRTAKAGVFGICSNTITESRKQIYSISPPFLTNIAILITHKDAPTLEAKKNIATTFSGFQAVAVKESTHEVWMARLKKELYPSLSIQSVSSGKEALQQVTNNPKLFTQLDFIYYLRALEEGVPIKRQQAADEISQSFGILMPLNSDWAPQMERFMKAFVGSNEYRKIVSKNLGPNALKLLDSVQTSQ